MQESMADPSPSDTRRKFTSIDDILQDVKCTHKEFLGMKKGHSSFGYYKFSSVVEDLIKQTIDIAIQIKKHRIVLDDLYEERKWLLAAYKDEAASNLRIENACAELQQRLILLEQNHKAGGEFSMQANQIDRGLIFAVAVLTLVTLVALVVVSCFTIMQMALDVLRASPKELILISLSLGIGLSVTLCLYGRLYLERLSEG
jgi:hypothetical protein